MDKDTNTQLSTQENIDKLRTLFGPELSKVQNLHSKRPNELGNLIVVGGPGGTGLSSVAKKIAANLGYTYLYAGGVMRQIAKDNGYDDIGQFVGSEVMVNSNGLFDYEVERRMILESQQNNVLIDSKVFGALSRILGIPTSVTIWITAELDVRTHRKYEKLGLASDDSILDKNSVDYIKTKQSLVDREEQDALRYNKLYGIEYMHQDKYNDIVFDSSKLDLESTVTELMLKLSKMGIAKDNLQADSNVTQSSGVSTPVGSDTDDQKVNNASETAAVIEGVAQVDDEYPEDLDERWNRWKCLNCGYLYEGSKPLNKCPKCGNEDPDKFD